MKTIFYKSVYFQAIPVSVTVFPLQMAKSSILWNPVIFVIMNPMVSISAFLRFTT
jgi:hypothetical protein